MEGVIVIDYTPRYTCYRCGKEPIESQDKLRRHYILCHGKKYPYKFLSPDWSPRKGRLARAIDRLWRR
jgi:hypothetical protein